MKVSTKNKKENRKCIYDVKQNAVNMKQHHETILTQYSDYKKLDDT